MMYKIFNFHYSTNLKCHKMLVKLFCWEKCWDKTQKLKSGQNSKTQIVTKLKNSNCGKTQKLKFWQNSKIQIVTKLKNTNCNKTQKIKLWQNSKTQKPKLWLNWKLKLLHSCDSCDSIDGSDSSDSCDRSESSDFFCL